MTSSLAPVLAEYLAAQLDGDLRGALVVLDAALSYGHTVAALQRGVVHAAQHEIGRMWQENELSVGEEHMATAVAQRALTHLFERATPAPPRHVTILVACVEGELHEFPARLVGDFLELGGFSVHYLGANVPIDELSPTIAVSPPGAVALSATVAFHAPALRATVAAVRERFPSLPLLAGGQIFEWIPELAEQLDAVVVGDDPGEIVSAFERAVEGGAPHA